MALRRTNLKISFLKIEERHNKCFFIPNILDEDIQRDLLRDTVEPEIALSIAVNIQMRSQNQRRSSSNTIATSLQFNDLMHSRRECNYTKGGRNSFNRELNSLCKKCEKNWTLNHCKLFALMGKKCNHSGLLNHFAKVCRKKNKVQTKTHSKLIG